MCAGRQSSVSMGLGLFNLVSSVLYSGFYCCLVGWGRGKEGGLEHARIVNPLGEQSWSQTAESEFMSVNGCLATARGILEQPHAEFC